MAVGTATTGDDVQHQMALMKARLIARYRLHAMPGRPEELCRADEQLGVSIGYGCKTVRVRKMQGRNWVDTLDFQIGEGWGSELYGWLDPFFQFASPNTVGPGHPDWLNGRPPRNAPRVP